MVAEGEMPLRVVSRVVRLQGLGWAGDVSFHSSKDRCVYGVLLLSVGQKEFFLLRSVCGGSAHLGL